ncbi:abdominal ganglion neuropeptide L11-like [Macrobrachium nipponense]|uniref:abdominal ganglion neuropeptide L11-like n=1 Tax=Macrobrachium nipponense TaxID=159736 RepID=UPI0030C82EA8
MASSTCRFHLCPAALLLLVAMSCLAAHAQAVDCRKFVFAPVCRGIIAKRTISETRSSLRPEPSPRQWGPQYAPATEDEDDGLLLAQSYEDPASLDPRSRKDMVLVRAGGDIVPAYVYGIFERGLQEERK